MAYAEEVSFLLSGLINSSGNPLSGGKVHTYEAGTTTPLATYTDKAGTIPATNPVVLNSMGQAQIYGQGSYKFVVTDSNDVTVTTIDNLSFGLVTEARVIHAGTSTGNANSQAITFSPFSTSFTSGDQVSFFAGYTNNATVTLSVNGVSATLKKNVGGALIALAANDLIAANYYEIAYQSSSSTWILKNPSSITFSGVQNGAPMWGGTSAGGANAQTLSLSPPITAYTPGLTVRFIAGFTNTADFPTLNVNGLGAYALNHPDGKSVRAEEIVIGGKYTATYLATNVWVLTESTPAWTTFNANPQGFLSTPANIVATFFHFGKLCIVNFSHDAQTSNATTFTITAPVQAAARTNAAWAVRLHTVVDNGAYSTSTAIARIGSGATAISLLFNQNGTTTWTASGSRQGCFTGLTYETV